MIEKAKLNHDKNYHAIDWNGEIFEDLKKTNEIPFVEGNQSSNIKKSRLKAYKYFKNYIGNHIPEGKTLLVDNFYIKQDLLFRTRIQKLCDGMVSSRMFSPSKHTQNIVTQR